MAKFKLGDLVLNKWAGDLNPTKVFCYIKYSGKYSDVVSIDDEGKLIKQQYYSSSFNEVRDGEEMYVKVGHTNAFDVLKNDIKAARDAEERTVRLNNGSLIEVLDAPGGSIVGSRADKINLW